MFFAVIYTCFGVFLGALAVCSGMKRCRCAGLLSFRSCFVRCGDGRFAGIFRVRLSSLGADVCPGVRELCFADGLGKFAGTSFAGFAGVFLRVAFSGVCGVRVFSLVIYRRSGIALSGRVFCWCVAGVLRKRSGVDRHQTAGLGLSCMRPVGTGSAGRGWRMTKKAFPKPGKPFDTCNFPVVTRPWPFRGRPLP